jgi:GxxExxY protein
MYELKKAGLKAENKVPVSIVYEDLKIDHAYTIDILVEDCVILSLKTVDEFTHLHEAEILTYMKLSKKELGLLINFDVPRLKDGIKRYRI